MTDSHLEYLHQRRSYQSLTPTRLSISLKDTDVMQHPVIVPELSAAITVRTSYTTDQLAALVGKALGVVFSDDLEGIFEELNALVAHIFGHIIGLYMVSEDEGESSSSDIFIDMFPLLSPSSPGLQLDRYEPVAVETSDFLIRLLLHQTELPFRPNSAVVQKNDLSIEEMVNPGLQANIKTETDLPLRQVAARIEASLGITFEETKHVGDEKKTEGENWYTCKAHSLGHHIDLYAAKSPYHMPLPRPIIFVLQPDTRFFTLDSDAMPSDTKTLPISDYLIAMLQSETDLPFQVA